MPKSKIILVLGCLIALLPVLGFPHAWEEFFEIVGGLGIVLLSVMISVDKRLTQKMRAERRQAHRRTQVNREVENLSQEQQEESAQEPEMTV